MRERFYLPEERTSFTAEEAEQANASAKKQTRYIFYFALFVYLSMGSTCYQSSETLTGFVIYVFVAGVFLFGLWKFHQRVEHTEKIRNAEKQYFPAEELLLNEKDMTWQIKRATPEKITIAWENLVCFGDAIEYDNNQRIEKVSIPRVVYENHKVVVEFIETYTKLKKVIKEKYFQGESVSYAVYKK